MIFSMFNVKLVVIIICIAFGASSTEYCEICQDHTLCKYPVAGPGPKCRSYDWSAQLSPDDVTEMVSRVNEKRNFVASGLSRHLPPAANMRKIVWSKELARFAQRWVDQCDDSTKSDQKDTCRDLAVNVAVGQTIATISGPAPGLQVRSFVDVWFMQTLVYKGSVSYYNGSQDGRSSGLTQLIWAETEVMGCGKARFLTDTKTLLERLVCNFARRGNIHGQPVYAVGFAASQCPENTAPDRVYPALCSVIPGSTSTTTERFIPKTSPVSSLLRILNLSNHSVTQELDPIKSSIKQSNRKGSDTSELTRNQKIRHARPENSNKTQGSPDIPMFWTNVVNDTTANHLQLHKLRHRQEKGHSRIHHRHSSLHNSMQSSTIENKEEDFRQYDLDNGHQAFHDFIKSSTTTLGSTEEDYGKYDFTTKPYLYSTVNDRNNNQNQCGFGSITQCTRRGTPCHATCETPSPSCRCAQNKCPRGENCNPCNCPGSCEHKPPCHLPPPPSPIPPPPPPPPPRNSCGCPIHHPTCTPPTTRCMCNSNCQCLNTKGNQRSGPRSEDKDEDFLDDSRRADSYDDEFVSSIPNTPKSDSFAVNPRKRLPWLIKRNKKIKAEEIENRRKQILNKQVKSNLQYTEYGDEDEHHSYGSFDSSVRKKREADDHVTFKPFWQVDRYSYIKPPDMKALRYTTLLPMPNRRNYKGSRRTTISIVTEPITTDIETTHQKRILMIDTHSNDRYTERYLSFEELMHLRKMSPENYDGRRSEAPSIDTYRRAEPSASSSSNRPMTMPSPVPLKKHCTRKITCTWTMATITDQYGSTILVFDDSDGIGSSSRTPYGYVEGCSRTSTCTRDYMDRNKISTRSTVSSDYSSEESTIHPGDGDDGDDGDDEYCERRDLSVRRRNLGDNRDVIESEHEAYSESPLSDETTEFISQQDATVTEEECACNRNRHKRDSKQSKTMNINCCDDKKNGVMTYGDLHYLILRKIIQTWKSNNQSSEEHKCMCNQSSRVKRSSLILWIILLFASYPN